MKLSVSTLPSEEENSLIHKYDQNSHIEKITISNLGDNISTINSSLHSPKAVPHVTLDKIKDNQQLQELITLIQKNDNPEVLLLNGSNTHLKKPTLDILDVITQLQENNITINIGAYIENLFWKKTDQKHFDTQAQVIKEKQNAGATRIITQGVFRNDNIEPFIKTLRDKGIHIPIEIGILLPDNRAKLLKFAKKICTDIAKQNMAQMDWYLRIAYSYFTNTTKAVEKIITLDSISENDAIYLQTFGQDATQTIEKVKQIIG